MAALCAAHEKVSSDKLKEETRNAIPGFCHLGAA